MALPVNPTRSPIAEAISKVAILSASSGRQRVLVVISDALQYGDDPYMKWECWMIQGWFRSVELRAHRIREKLEGEAVGE